MFYYFTIWLVVLNVVRVCVQCISGLLAVIAGEKMFNLRFCTTTNKQLSEHGIKDIDKCKFCGLEPESLLHPSL